MVPIRMARSWSIPLLAVALLAGGCRRVAPGLDDGQRLAYRAKPAVVRVNAYGTAKFEVPSAALAATLASIRALGLPSGELAATTPTVVVDCGSGGSGSGFVVTSDGCIVTSSHVIAPARNEARLRGELARNGAIAALLRQAPVETLRELARRGQLDGIVAGLAAAGSLRGLRLVDEVELSNGERAAFKVLRESPPLEQGGADLALLRVSRNGLPTLPLGDSDSTRVGTSVWAIGYPAVASSTDEVIGGWLSRDSDLEATFNPGTITAIKRDATGHAVLQTNAAIYRGNSGGPVVDADGEVVGISTWGHSQAEQIKFLVPAAAARSMLAAARIEAGAPGPFDREYRRALDAASRGDWLAARKSLAAASLLFRNSPDVARLRRDVDRGVATLAPWQRHPLIAGAAGALALAAIGFAGLLASGRSARSVVAAVAEAAEKPEVRVRPARTGGGEEVLAVGGTGEGAVIGRLTVLNGARTGERLALGGSGIRIGRESSMCEIVLENPKISRLHAEIVSIDGKVMLIDRNSSNGTYVNDQKVDRHILRDGDVIYFGGRNAVAVAFHV